MSTGSELYDLLAKTNATLNPNNTITLRFNDGSSYTTGVIKDGPELSPADKAMEEAKEASVISQAAMEEANKAAVAAGNAEQSASEAAASATNAENFASEAQQSASTASTAATNAETSAGNAATSASNAATNAQAAATSASAAEGSAQTAATEASEAKTQATNASEYASRALGNLSTVQSVTETLNWITAHGTMTLTSDTALDPSHVYFVRNNDGDYVVGGNHYSVVTEPNVDNISTYYELTIDESLNNYVGTHLSVTSEGLWLLPDAGGNKILIATGQGQTYTSAGTYIVGKVNGVDTVLASFLASGVQIGQDSESHLNMDYHSMRLVDKEGDTYFHISDLRDRNGRLTETFTSGSVAAYDLAAPADTIMTVLVNDVSTTEYTRTDFSLFTRIILDTRPEVGSEVKIIYTPNTTNTKAYTLGTRNNGTVAHIGMYSVAEGFNLISSGLGSHSEGMNCEASGIGAHAEGCSTQATHEGAHSEGQVTKAWGDSAHSEGDSTIARGLGAHSEGYKTTAYGFASHAQNIGSYAKKDAQTVIGTCAKIDSATTTTHPDTSGDYDYGQYALIIGNGVLTGPNTASRSNALTVDWNGVPVGHNSNGTEIDYEISDATIAKYVALGMSLT